MTLPRVATINYVSTPEWQQEVLRPVIDGVLAFGEAREVYEHLAKGRHFGKVVIKVN